MSAKDTLQKEMRNKGNYNTSILCADAQISSYLCAPDRILECITKNLGHGLWLSAQVIFWKLLITYNGNPVHLGVDLRNMRYCANFWIFKFFWQ